MGKSKSLLKENNFLEIWKWQNFKFNDNILDTIIKTRLGLNELKIELKNEFKKFNIQII